MKKVLSILLVFALLFPLVSCVTKKEKEKAKNKVTVYGDGVIPNIIASTRIPSTAVDDIMKIRGTLRTRLGSNPGYGSDTTEKSGVEIVFGDTSRAVTARAKEFLPTRDGDEATYVIYFDEDGAAVVWNHDYAAIVGVKYFADNYLGEATLKIASGTKYVGTLSVSAYAEELRMQEEERVRREEAAIEAEWATRFDVIEDPDVRAAVKDFYETFYEPEKIIRWWAGLYDPEIGGFYYANSARDNAGYRHGDFLPDMESTWQIVNRLRQFDRDLAVYLGRDITAKIVEFYQTRQDPSDGYFYHPQWTKAESRANNMRYTRDQDWAIAALKNLHAEPLYPTALDRAKSSGSTVDVTVRRLASYAGLTKVTSTPAVSADWQPNETSVKNYVNNLMNTTSCEHWSNQLDTQISTFEANGVLDYVLDVLDERVNPEYGLWVTGYNANTDTYYNLRTLSESDTRKQEAPYGIFTNTYKVMKVYNAGDRLFPYSTKMVENAMKAINSKDPGARITYIFNPWATLGQVRTNLKNGGVRGLTLLDEYDALIKDNILELINSLKSSLGIYKHADGSYSFLPDGTSSPTIYGTPVSLGLNEGDVNAHNLVISFATHICTAIGLNTTISVFNANHGKLMQQLLKNAPNVPKKGDPAQQTEEASVTRDFTSDAVGSAPSGTTQSSSDDAAVQNGTTFRVVEEPNNTSNKVLEISKNTEGNVNGRQLFVPLLAVDEMTDATTLEISMRMNLTGDTRYGNSISGSNPNIMQIGFMSQSDMFWMPVVRFSGNGYTLMTTSSTSGGNEEYPDNESKIFQFDTWYEFTFRLTIKNYGKSNAQFKVEILVDGEAYGTSTNFYSNSIAFQTGKTVRVRFHPQMRIHALIYVDDITATLRNSAQ